MESEWMMVEFDRFGQAKNQDELKKMNEMLAHKEELELAETSRGRKKLRRKADKEQKSKKKLARREKKKKKKIEKMMQDK